MSTGNPIADGFLVALGAFVVTWSIAFMVRLAEAPVNLYHEEKKKNDLAKSGMELVFPAECNSEGKESLFKRSWSPLCKADGVDRKISFHQFFIGIHNPSTGKTLRNVRLVLESIPGPGGQILNRPFTCDRTSTDAIDIQPKGMEYFLIGEGADDTDAGLFHLRFMEKLDYDRLLAVQDSRANIGFILMLKNVPLSLLKNDGQILEINAYADDVPPAAGKITINTRKRIELFLEDRADVES